MEAQIKTTVKAGNSSAVILPRSWLDKDVRVELVKKTYETMLLDVINISKRYIDLKEIIGVYLVGSYARKEEDENSDIDILIQFKGRKSLFDLSKLELPINIELKRNQFSLESFIRLYLYKRIKGITTYPDLIKKLDEDDLNNLGIIS